MQIMYLPFFVSTVILQTFRGIATSRDLVVHYYHSENEQINYITMAMLLDTKHTVYFQNLKQSGD